MGMLVLLLFPSDPVKGSPWGHDQDVGVATGLLHAGQKAGLREGRRHLVPSCVWKGLHREGDMVWDCVTYSTEPPPRSKPTIQRQREDP